MVLKIALSAGHGPNTPGKRAPDGFREFYFTYPTANYVAQYLGEYQDVSVLKVYDGSSDVPLGTRTSKAASFGANVYVSIHGNAYGSEWNAAHGIETLVYNAAAGNKAYAIAQKVQANLITATGLTNRGIKTRPDLWEMRKTTMPAFLCECGFYTNQTERALMGSATYQQKIARAIVNGLASYYGLKKKTTTVAPKPTTPTTTPSTGGTYKVQIGAFSVYKNAQVLEATAKAKGFNPFVKKEGTLYKVQVGAFSSKANAEAFLKTVKSKGFINAVVAK